MKLRCARAFSIITLCAVTSCGDPAPTTGGLIVEVVGLPSPVLATVVVTGPAGFSRTVQSTTTLEALPPGEYIVSGALLTTATALYQPVTTSQTVNVTAGQTQSVVFTYQLASGSIMLTAAGLPDGVGPSVAIASGSFLRTVTSAGLISAIPPGDYVVRADTFSAINGDRFGATVVTQSVTITASETPIPVSLEYGPASGTLSLAVNGLSATVGDAVTIAGPSGFLVRTSASIVLRGLRPGTYTVAPRQIIQCPSVFTPTTAEQPYDVALAQVTEAAVAFAASQPGPETLNLTIDRAYLTQAVQNESATLPIVAGRPALLRVFGTANQCNTATPSVKVRFSTGDSVVIPAPEASVRFESPSTAMTASWNAFLSADRIQPGLTFEAIIDDARAIPEANEDDNRFPTSGPSTQMVTTMPRFDVTFVPIEQTGVIGHVNDANVSEYLHAVRQMLPLGEIVPVVSAPYLTSVVLGNGTSSAFVSILNELEMKRVNDFEETGYAGNYYGVLRPAQGVTFVQVGGIAFIGGKTALGITVGWFNNARQATELVAHELSHNFGQRHAPCGSAGSPDPAFPYASGSIGVTGYDLYNAAQVGDIGVKSPSTPDIMGYCNNPWISDYMYGRIINFRSPPGATVATVAAGPADAVTGAALLVSGMVSPDSIRIDPAFQIQTRRTPSPTTGSERIEGRAADGTLLFQTPITALPTDHGDPTVRYFTVAIPVAEATLSRLQRLELIGSGRRVTRRSGGSSERVRLVAPDAAATEAGAQVSARSASLVDVEWDASQWPAILIRDAARRTLLGVGRGGRATVASRTATIELVMSDGTRSATVRSRVSGR